MWKAEEWRKEVSCCVFLGHVGGLLADHCWLTAASLG